MISLLQSKDGSLKKSQLLLEDLLIYRTNVEEVIWQKEVAREETLLLTLNAVDRWIEQLEKEGAAARLAARRRWYTVNK